MIQFDVEPQQTLLGNLQTGMQIVATINMEELIDGCYLDSEKTAFHIGKQLIDLLKNNGSLIGAIDPEKHFANIRKEIENP